MTVGRILAGATASAAVLGCAGLAVAMSRAGGSPTAATSPTPAHTAVTRPAYLPISAPAGSATTPATIPAARGPASGALTSSHRPAARPSGPAATAAVVHRPGPSTAARVVRTTPPVTRRTAPRPSKAAPLRGQPLPVHYSTGTATRVITVTARSTGSTTASLQAWNKAPGGGWLHYGPAVTAHVGADGLSTSPSEYRSATPIGSFTLTQAFGYDSNPGTALPYLHTTSADWWISEPGSLYNTHQRCSSGCPFTRGSPNEHLYYERPYYAYAVVIDYNTRNAPGGVRAGAGSAFFLHVTDGQPTAGCVAIAQPTLVSLMHWLTPAAHPRILIGVG